VQVGEACQKDGQWKIRVNDKEGTAKDIRDIIRWSAPIGWSDSNVRGDYTAGAFRPIGHGLDGPGDAVPD
jgi:hypothetical protein